MLSRRRFVGEVLGGLLVTGVAGCAANPTSTLGLELASFGAKSRSPDEYPMTPEQISKLPYATLGVRLAKNPRAVVVLATIDGQELHWVSADRVSFYTSNGWLMRTHGLQRDLGATRWVESAGDPLRSFVQTGAVPARGVYREIDLRHEDEKAIAIESRFELVRDETIVIQGREHLTHRLDERANLRAWRWHVRNSFWIDAQSGQVRRSVQQYCPEMPPIELEILKPAAV